MKASALRKLRSTITLGLIVWCAGAGCMLVSYEHSVRMIAAEVSAAVLSKPDLSQASGSAGAHACCKARHSSERRVASPMPAHAAVSESVINHGELTEPPSSSDAMSCCPLTSGTFVVSGRQGISNDNASVVWGFDVSIIKGSAGTPSAISQRLPDQNQTYLRGCVFLI